MNHAMHADIPRCVEMGARFFRDSGQSGGFVADHFADTLASLIEQDRAALIVSDRGMIGGVLVPSFCNRDWLIAVELFWWAEDGQGLRLLRAFEDWAVPHEIRITTQDANTRPDKALLRKGYARMETSFKRTLCH